MKLGLTGAKKNPKTNEYIYMEIPFAQVFLDPLADYKKDDTETACRDGLLAWAKAQYMDSVDLPKGFNRGMKKIEKVLGVKAYPDTLLKYAEEVLNARIN